MTVTGHAVIGTVIAAKIGNPALAIPLALVSHIAADMFPHWDTGVNRHKKTVTRFIAESATDGIISYIVMFLLVTYVFVGTDLLYAFVIVIAAQLLDYLSGPYLFLNIKNPPFFYWIYLLQKKFDNGQDTLLGKAGQAAVLIALVIAAWVI